MQFRQRGDRMKYLFFISLLLLSSCISAVRNNEISRNVQPIEFSKVDANEDGKITEEETKAFNALEQTNTNISTPLYVSIGILLVSVVGCAVLVKKKKCQYQYIKGPLHFQFMKGHLYQYIEMHQP